MMKAEISAFIISPVINWVLTMTTILIDGPNLSFAAHYGVQERLSDAQGRPTACLFGFIRMLRAIIDRTQTLYPGEPLQVLVAWDAARNTLWRRQCLPSYKGSRDTKVRTPEEEIKFREYVDQLPKLRSLLPILGVGQIKADTYEADDIAGWLTGKYPNRKWILASGDQDWLQLVSEQAWVWQPTKGQYVTPENFTEVTGARDTAMFIQMKAIMGDKGDDIPGAQGIGNGYALKYLNGNLKKGKKYEAIAQWINDPMGYERSLKLVDLRSTDIPSSCLSLLEGRLDKAQFSDFCIQYGFGSIYDAFHIWIAPFEKMTGSV